MGSGSPVSQFKAGPSENDLARLEEEIAERLSDTAEVHSKPPAESSFAAELTLTPEPSPDPAPSPAPAPAAAPAAAAPEPAPWHIRHARALVALALLVAAGVALFSYYPWRQQTDPSIRKPPAPAAPPLAVKAPEAPPPPVSAVPAPPPAKPAPAAPPRAAVPVAPAAPPRATINRTSPPAVSAAAPATGPRNPAVTHTLRDEPEPKPAAAAAAPVPAAAPKAAAPSDCPEQIAALGLCASFEKRGTK
jgi:lysophospholipase